MPSNALACLCSGGCKEDALSNIAKVVATASQKNPGAVNKVYSENDKTWHVYRVQEKNEDTNEYGKTRIIWGAGHVNPEALDGDVVPVVHEDGKAANKMLSCGFRFRTRGKVRSVQVEHKDGIFYIICDGKYANAVAHDTSKVFSSDRLVVYFKVTVPGQRRRVSAEVRMSWRRQHWEYIFNINNITVPACWTNRSGFNHLAYAPEVIDLDVNFRDINTFLAADIPRGLRIERMFSFSTHGHLRRVAFCRAHFGSTRARDWKILLDGQIVSSLTLGSVNDVNFEVLVPGGSSAQARAQVGWEGYSTGWVCSLNVNDVPVPQSLSRDNGGFSAMYGPEVIDLEQNAVNPCGDRYREEYGIGENSLHIVTVFQFVTQGQLRGVAITHARNVWNVFCDGIQVCSSGHNHELLKSTSAHIEFTVPTQSGQGLPAVVNMTWRPSAVRWKYGLKVNGIELQMCWSRHHGDRCSPLLEVENLDEYSNHSEESTRASEVGSDIAGGELVTALLIGNAGTPSENLEPSTQSSDDETLDDIPQNEMSEDSGCFSTNDVESDSECFMPYAIGDHVEYYSWSHGKWMLGVFRGKQRLAEGYIVDIVRGQRRMHVHLDCLRSPLEAGALVEVFSQRKGWIPGIVSGLHDPRRATMKGYKVQLSKGATLCDVPAERLRRRFPAGISTEVWRGSSAGWVKASVDERMMSADGSGASAFLDCETPHFMKLQEQRMDLDRERMGDLGLTNKFFSLSAKNLSESDLAHARLVGRLQREAEEAAEHAAELEPHRVASKLDPWIVVPVLEGGSPSGRRVSFQEMVPSYLLRRCSDEVQETSI